VVERFSISIEKDLFEEFEKFIKERGFANRSEAIRELIREKLAEEKWLKGKESFGILAVIYDHTKRELEERLTSSQHHHLKNIIATLHIHLDEKNCLEIITIKGKPEEIKKVSKEITGKKGLKISKFLPLTVP